MRAPSSPSALRAAAEEWRTLADRAGSAGFLLHAESLRHMADLYERNAELIERSRRRLGL
jgi:hypothetical protein